MGARLSLNVFSPRVNEPIEATPSQMCKRQKSTPCYCDENQRLIPSLPDEISLQILARIPRTYYLGLKLVSWAWKTAIISNELFNLRKELRTTEEWLYLLTKIKDTELSWYALDTLSGRWQRLPPMPTVSLGEESKKGSSAMWMWNMGGLSIRIADAIVSRLGKRDALDMMPFCGCAVAAFDGCLYVLGGFSRASAVGCVWKYDPVLNAWREASSMSIGRAYCKTGVLNNKLYAVGGVTRGNSGLTPLQSAEVFDPRTGIWSQIPNMPFSKAQVLPTAFLADLLKPMATGLTSFRGKLFVPQSLYCWPFFVDIGGEFYDPDVNSWGEMPMGMCQEWRSKQAGMKLSVIVDGEMYAVDPSTSLEYAKIKVYDHQSDTWNVVVEDVPILDLPDSESPFLLAGSSGELQVITKDSNNNISVLQADVKSRLALLKARSSCSGDVGSRGLEDSETSFARVIATRALGSFELVSCQTINV